MGVKNVVFLNADFLEEQWNALFADMRPAVIKIGALGSSEIVLRIAKLLSSAKAKGIPVVLDPVLGSTSGTPLFEKKALPVLTKRIFPLCRVITPNIDEFSTLCGKKVDATNASSLLREFGSNKPYAILLKGGHLSGPNSADLLFDKGRISRFENPRLSKKAHGTGCVLASSIASNLAQGCKLPAACSHAKTFVHEAMATMHKLGKGRSPLNLWV